MYYSDDLDCFVAHLHEICTKDEEATLDYVFSEFHPLIIRDRNFERVNHILRQVDVDILPVSVLMGLLMTTYTHKTMLNARKDLFIKAKTRIEELSCGLLPCLNNME